jgi:SAM-dependent methyltransferase
MQPLAEQSDPITPDQLRQIHAKVISEPQVIRTVLDHAWRAAVVFRRGMNAQILPETARLTHVADHEIVLETRNFEKTLPQSVHLNFALGGLPYFFSTPPLSGSMGPVLRLIMPSALYQAERRDRVRTSADNLSGWPRVVSLSTTAGIQEEGEVADVSPGGMGVLLRRAAAAHLSGALRVRIPRDAGSTEEVFGEVRNQAPTPERPGWVRIGLSTTYEGPRQPLRVERRALVSPNGSLTRLRERIALLGGMAATRLNPFSRRSGSATQVPIVDYANARGERIRAIVTSWGSTVGAPAVVIPPAWGRTKETLQPLAETIVETFRRHGRPVAVVRFDGTRKRGESYKDPDCREPGREHLKFTFSGGVEDIRATLDFLEQDPRFRPSKSILVTFSAAAVEGRRAVASDVRKRVGGWVSVVGTADLQTSIRVISGGIDFFAGVDRGVRFGLQEILGVLVDMDCVGRDALDSRLVYLQDALEDMRKISVPVTWVHGRHDAWMNLERARLLLAAGDSSERRLIEVPTGHQLRSSREALETFQLIASEVGRICTGKPFKSALPGVRRLEEQRRAERARAPKPTVDLKTFWKSYLLGRSEGRLGIGIMTRTSAYHDLMEAQVKGLRLSEGSRVVDLGAGTGAFLEFLGSYSDTPSGLTVDALDFVWEALNKARTHGNTLVEGRRGLVHCVACDLATSGTLPAIPLQYGIYDAILASLLLSYVTDPAGLLREMRRLLKPGGRVVVSSLRKDADISKLFLESYPELLSLGASHPLAQQGGENLTTSLREFLNDASRLLDLEELGLFHFWDEAGLVALLRSAGFDEVETTLAFGTPPQAIVVSGRRA